MSTFTRARTKRQQRHPASRCKDHFLDKQQGEARQRTAWMAFKTSDQASPKRAFHGLEGHEYIYNGKQWKRCEDPEKFADHIETEAGFRSWYKKRTTRIGVAVDMKRPVETPVEVLTTSFAPWLSDCIAAEVSAGRDPRSKLAVIRNQWLQFAQSVLATQRYLLGYAFHADTDDLHFDLVCTRQDGKGGRIGKAGLKLAGPWSVGVDRQLRAGATISDEKRNQLRRSAVNFRNREGAGVIPLDVALARALDNAAESVLGSDLVSFRRAYAARVPELERQHAAARLATLEAARDLLIRKAPYSPDTRGMSDTAPMPEPNFSSPGI